MRQTLEYIKMAFRNIVANKMRSLLTMLGIIIGISAVIIVLCVGGGGKKAIEGNLSGISTGSVYLLGTQNATESDMFTDGDMEAVANIPGVAGVTMDSTLVASVRGTRDSVAANIVTANDDYYKVFPATLQSGRLWTQEDYEAGRKVCTIDSAGAKEVFGSDNVLGMTIDLVIDGKSLEFTIVGIIKSSGSAMTMGGGPKANINVPISCLLSSFDYLSGPYYAIALIGEDPNRSAELAELAKTTIELRHGNLGMDMYSIMDISVYMEQINSTINIFTSIIAGIAAISLLVGGIGVMNIMLVSVTERTREIGIRKALGAKTGTILFQFLIESSALTLIGGVIGILLGVLGGIGLGGLIGIEPDINIFSALLIALFSSLIGIFFGIYPARKAAKLNPIEALRSE